MFQQAGHALQTGQQHQLFPVGQFAEGVEKLTGQQRRFSLDGGKTGLGEGQMHLALVTFAADALQQVALFQPVNDGAERGLGYTDALGQIAQSALAHGLDAVQDQQLDRRQAAIATQALGVDFTGPLQPAQGQIKIVHHVHNRLQSFWLPSKHVYQG